MGIEKSSMKILSDVIKIKPVWGVKISESTVFPTKHDNTHKLKENVRRKWYGEYT